MTTNDGSADDQSWLAMQESNIPVPHHIIVDREGLAPGMDPGEPLWGFSISFCNSPRCLLNGLGRRGHAAMWWVFAVGLDECRKSSLSAGYALGSRALLALRGIVLFWGVQLHAWLACWLACAGWLGAGAHNAQASNLGRGG
jgi:hypothetical protein